MKKRSLFVGLIFTLSFNIFAFAQENEIPAFWLEVEVTRQDNCLVLLKPGAQDELKRLLDPTPLKPDWQNAHVFTTEQRKASNETIQVHIKVTKNRGFFDNLDYFQAEALKHFDSLIAQALDAFSELENKTQILLVDDGTKDLQFFLHEQLVKTFKPKKAEVEEKSEYGLELNFIDEDEIPTIEASANYNLFFISELAGEKNTFKNNPNFFGFTVPDEIKNGPYISIYATSADDFADRILGTIAQVLPGVELSAEPSRNEHTLTGLEEDINLEFEKTDGTQVYEASIVFPRFSTKTKIPVDLRFLTEADNDPDHEFDFNREETDF
ncbi:MAG: hypothetical protein AB7F43_10620 [Bacteriovoracia bacterium]